MTNYYRLVCDTLCDTFFGFFLFMQLILNLVTCIMMHFFGNEKWLKLLDFLRKHGSNLIGGFLFGFEVYVGIQVHTCPYVGVS